MKTKQLIIFTGKNLNDLFELDCVKFIMKSEGEPLLILNPKKVYACSQTTCVVMLGDIMEQMEDGTWKITRTTSNKVKLQ